MKIAKLEAVSVGIPFRDAYRSDHRFYHMPDVQENVIVRLTTDEGVIGIGEAVHIPGLLGETPGATLGALQLYHMALLGADPLRITELNVRLDELALTGNVAARAALDVALHDVAARVLGVPVYQLFGGRVHAAVPTEICPATYAGTIVDVLAYLDEGFKYFKVKMSGDLEYDLPLVEKLLEAVHLRDAVLILDPNQGWSVRDTLRAAHRVERFAHYDANVIFEQPVRASDVRGLALVRRSSSIRITADDVLRGLGDLIEVIEREAADIVNLKVSRVGGFQRCREMIALAEAWNVSYVIDELTEMRVANTAVSHLAVASRSPVYTGVCCHLFLERDIATAGGVSVRNGCAIVSDEPGLGIAVGVFDDGRAVHCWE